MDSLNRRQAMNAALYILGKLGEMDARKMYKLLYFADREHLCEYGRTITRDDYLALEHGPVPERMREVVRAARGECLLDGAATAARAFFTPTGRRNIKAAAPANMKCLSGTDVKCLNKVLELYGDKPFEELSELSHQSAWRGTERNARIPKAAIMREGGCEESFVEYVTENDRWEEALRNAVA